MAVPENQISFPSGDQAIARGPRQFKESVRVRDALQVQAFEKRILVARVGCGRVHVGEIAQLVRGGLIVEGRVELATVACEGFGGGVDVLGEAAVVGLVGEDIAGDFRGLRGLEPAEGFVEIAGGGGGRGAERRGEEKEEQEWANHVWRIDFR